MAHGDMNPDLQRERNKATFDIENLTYQLDGTKDSTKKRRKLQKLVQEDPLFVGRNYHFMSREELYEEGIRKNFHMVKRIRELELYDQRELYYLRSAIFPNEALPASLQTSMFIPTLLGQANEEQQERWLQKALNYEIIGTYAQTEMGHGTFLRGLETTATYDPEKQEFVIHSPTLTATKWWPGGLGKTSNYAVVMADLIIKGKRYGPHSFMVQLRDLSTHKPLPGITLGDIGPKFGYNMIDNGFLRLDKVRIPQTDMLMKHAKVLPDGTYVKGAHAKLSYGTMVFVRAMIIWDVAAKGLAQCVTIAIRYSCVRRQSEIKPGAPEPQVLDFQSQQHKLFLQLASAYAFMFAGQHMALIYMSINAEIQSGNVNLLPELHGLSSGLKAYTTAQAAVGMEVCRMSCGGHGYSQASGIPKIYGNAVPGCTYEGENTVMYLQCARYLLKNYMTAQTGEKLSGSVAYLSEKSSSKCSIDKSLSLASLVETHKHRAHSLVKLAAKKLSLETSRGKDHHDAWNHTAVHWIRAAMAHAEYCIMKIFAERIATINNTSIVEVLTPLCQLFALHIIVEHAGDLLMDGYLSVTQLDMCRDAEVGLLSIIRPNAVPLVDAFDFSDRTLGSVLGRFDGQVYENLYKWAQESPLNKTQVHPSFEKYVKPVQQLVSKL